MSRLTLSVRRGLGTPAERANYLAALNRCFPGWGDHSQWAWCFERTVAERSADFLQIAAAGSAIAGSAITYRRIGAPGGDGPIAAIMTGSWTLPEARGAGAFTRMIQESVDVAAARGAAVLLAFVTAANPSRRRLEAAGASLTPTFYCRSGAASHAIDPHLRELPPPSGLDLRQRSSESSVSFAYTAEEWRGQFVDRPGALRVIEDRARWTAVVEHAGAFERLHALHVERGAWPEAIDALAARALQHGRQLFVFTASAAEAVILRDRGFAIVDGFLTALPTGPRTPQAWPATSGWQLQNGDRM
jgi:ribosomal protein S18 acetylase RimI-like enzyme